MQTRCFAGILPLRALFVVVLSLAGASTVTAAEWLVEPSLELSESYTDNVNLAPPGAEDSDFITQVNPGISLSGQGRRLALDFYYRMQNLFYASDSDQSTTNHQMNADLTSEIVRDVLFFDASSRLTQVLASADSSLGSSSNLGISDDRQDVFSAEVSPYIRTILGGAYLTELRYTATMIDYQGDDSSSVLQGSSTSEAYEFFLSNEPLAQRLTWNVNARTSTVDHDDDDDGDANTDEQYRSAALGLSYQLTSHFALRSSAGYEDNDYPVSGNEEKPEGEFYTVGFQWNPSRRLSVGADYGYRYFGNTWNTEIVHNRRRDTFTLRYSEDISSQSNLLLQEQVAFTANPDGSVTPVIDPATGELVTLLIPGESNEIFIRSVASLEWLHRLRRSDLSILTSYEQRDYQQATPDESVSRGSLRWRWNPTRQSVFSLSLSRSVIDSDDGNIEQLREYAVGLERRLARAASARFDYLHSDHDVDGSAEDYVENVLTAGLVFRF